MSHPIMRRFVQCLPRNGVPPVNPAACSGGIIEHVACGFLQPEGSSNPGPDIELYNALINGPFNQNNFRELDLYALDVSQILTLVRQNVENCTSTLPRRIYDFKFATNFTNYITNPITGVAESAVSTIKTMLLLGGVDENQAREIGPAFQNRMRHFRPDPSPTPSSDPSSENYSWIGYIFLGAIVVLGFALFGYYRSRKSRENSLLSVPNNSEKYAINFRRELNRYYDGSSASLSRSSVSISRSSLLDPNTETPVPTFYHEIQTAIESVFKKSDIESFYLRDSSNSANNNMSLVQDHAWAFLYNCQSFYRPSGEPDFARHGDISEDQFLQLTDLEKIQLFQLRGIMASALTATRKKMTKRGIEAEQTIIFDNHRQFTLEYFNMYMPYLKQLALRQLDTISVNLTQLKPAEAIAKSDSDYKSDERDLIDKKLKINRLAAGIFLKDQIEDAMPAKIEQRILDVNASIRMIRETDDYIPSERVSALFEGMID